MNPASLMLWLALSSAPVALSADRPRPAPPDNQGWRATYTVETDTGYGMVCATGPFTGFIPAHVEKGADGKSLKWSRGVNGGTLTVTQRYGKRDLVAVISDTPFPEWATLAQAAPQQGSTLWIRGYVWFDLNLPGPLRQTTLVMADDDTLVTEGSSAGGSSGSCVWDDAGLVYAIHVHYTMWAGRVAEDGTVIGGRPPIQLAGHEPIWGGWAR